MAEKMNVVCPAAVDSIPAMLSWSDGVGDAVRGNDGRDQASLTSTLLTLLPYCPQFFCPIVLLLNIIRRVCTRRPLL